MRRFAALILSVFLTSGTALADSPKDADPQPAKSGPAKSKATRKAGESTANFAAELEELRQTMQAQAEKLETQQEQLQILKEELGKRDRQIDEAREEAAAANARASEAVTKATDAASTTAEVKSSEATLISSFSNLKASNEVLTSTVATVAAKSNSDNGQGGSGDDAVIRFKGITLTPGGYVAAETITRSRATSADIATPFTAIPYPGNALAHVSENNFSARQTRASLLAESHIGSVKLSGYYEGDFLGTGVTSNNRQVNSYVFRQRQIWGQVKSENGWAVVGGQMWTLATENRKGIDINTQATGLQIDPNQLVGFTWGRQYGFRVVKDFGSKFYLAAAIEEPQATIGGRGFSTVTNTSALGVATTSQNFFLNAPGATPGAYNAFDPTGYTVNKSPDFIFKAALEPGWGHYELLGIVSTFRNRVYPCGVVGTTADNLPTPAAPVVVACTDGTTTPSATGAFNSSATGGGVGASARVPLLSKKVEFNIKAVAGDGIGRYGSAQLSDLTARPDGTDALIRSAHGYAGLEFHPTPKWDVYLYGGSEYAWRTAYQGYTTIAITNTPAIPATATAPAIPATSNTTIKLNQIGGYGSPFANNSGCSEEKAPTSQLIPSAGGTCAGDIRVITEATLGFWHKIYQGPKGGLRWGIQYSYVTKSGWSGNDNVLTSPGISPKAVDNMIWTSFRYYIP
jgi:hypothetical protein